MTAFPADLLRQCVFLAGPTASGKTALGVELATRIGAEVVALDSMTLYRGLDIGTAKPTLAERRGVPHHLFDLLDPSEDYSVAEYIAAAGEVCERIVSRGHVPLFVGGTGLYLRSLLRGLFEGPAADWELRQRLEQELAEQGADSLHAKLLRVDPVLANRLPPQDVRRIIRGLEVYELTGRPLSEQQSQAELPAEARPTRVYWLDADRAWLHRRIELRARQMFADGLVEETQRVLAGQGFGRTASRALGYAEVLSYLNGDITRDEAIERTIIHTRQFAKRQGTWFRNLAECRAIPVKEGTDWNQVVEDLAMPE